MPDAATARALARHWSLIAIGQTTPAALSAWTIVTREFRENLQWAIIVPSDREITPTVARLLSELTFRGIPLQRL